MRTAMFGKILGAIAAFSPTLCAAASLSLDDLIVRLKTCEDKIHNVQWKAHLRVIEIADPSDVNSIIKTRPEKVDVAVIYDLTGKRYHVDYQNIATWSDGAAPYASTRQCIAYDGSLYRRWQITKAGTTIPAETDQPVEGTIRADRDSNWMPMRCWQISCIPPFFDDLVNDPQPLSQLLRQLAAAGKPIEIRTAESGICTIAVTDPKKYDDTMEICIDPSHGCKLIGVKWLRAEDRKLWREVRVKSREAVPGVWVPERHELIYVLSRPIDMTRVDYEDVIVNAKLADDVFLCDFPEGTQIDDQVRKQRYRASSSKRFVKNAQERATGGPISGTTSAGDNAELHFRLPDGEAWPKNALSKIVLKRGLSAEQRTEQAVSNDGSGNFELEACQKQPGYFMFQLARETPSFFVTLHAPGFLQFFEAGPFTPDDIKNGVIEVPLPKPASLDVNFDPGTGRQFFGAATVQVQLQLPSRGTFLTLANQSDALKAESLHCRDLPPGEYRVQVNTTPLADSIEQSAQELNPGRFFDSKKITLQAGQSEKVDLHYTPLDLNAFHGDRTAIIQIKSADGNPAAIGREMKIFYADGHYGFLPVFSGKVPESGEITQTNLTSVHPQSIETRQPYSVQFDNRELGTFECNTRNASERFAFLWPPQAGDMAPDIELFDTIQGKTIKLSDLRGKLVLIDFWATWCGMCALPLKKLDETVAQQTSVWKDRVMVIPLSVDDEPQEARQSLADRGLNHLNAYWSGKTGKGGRDAEAWRAFVLDGIPESVLINGEGRIIWRGYPPMDNGNKRMLEARIEGALK